MQEYKIKHFDDAATEFYIQLVQYVYAANALPYLNNAINNLFFYKTIIVFNDDKPCGYCVVYNNPELIFENKQCLAIGNWECINEDDVAKLLLDECTKISIKLQLQNIIGPINGSTWDNYRFTLNDNGNNFLGEMQHKFFYSNQWVNNNFKILANYISTIDTQLELYNPEKLEKYRIQLHENNITIRNMNLDNFKKEIENIFEFCEASFKNNFLYTPISKSVFVNKYLSLKKYLDAQYIFIAEQNSTIIAFLFAYPDHLSKTEKRIILKTIANAPLKQNAGLAYIMANLLIENCKQNNVQKIIHAYMHQTNTSTLNSKKYESEPFKQYALFIKTI
jgi:hypothetical protein